MLITRAYACEKGYIYAVSRVSLVCLLNAFQSCKDHIGEEKNIHSAMTRMLYIASSHGKSMDWAIRHVDHRVQVKGIWKSGGKVLEMIEIVKKRMGEILRFDPDCIIIHLGHNDISYHYKFNPRPRKVKLVVEDLHVFYLALSFMMPNAKVVVSCPFPRVSSEESGYTAKMAKGYNGEAVRASERLGSKKRDISTCFVKSLWKRVKKDEGNSIYFQPCDGLHLLPAGKIVVAREWLRACQ